jgi:hypothetical protein
MQYETKNLSNDCIKTEHSRANSLESVFTLDYLK